MNPNPIMPNWRLFYWFAGIGILIYLLVQIVPTTAESFFGTNNESIIAKSNAESIADDFVLKEFGVHPISVHAVHQSDSLLYGYLEKNKLRDNFDKKFDPLFPTDSFQVTAKMPDHSEIFVYVHMQKGTIIGWSRLNGSNVMFAKGNELTDAAVAFAAMKGFDKSRLSMYKLDESSGRIWYTINNTTIGKSKLIIEIHVEKLSNGSFNIATYKPKFQVPNDYTEYVTKQKKLANYLSIIGSLFLSIVLFILATIYAPLYRKHTSFLRGIVLTSLFLIFYAINNFNLMDGIVASYGETLHSDSMAFVAIIVTLLITVVMALSVYFSLVAGDGSWRSLGRNLWPRFGQFGYGEHVWRSMWLGYLAAFMLLGLQTIIFIVLMNVNGAWSTTDVTQSPYNLAIPWLFPLLAFCAAISEEAVFRLFGIGLMKKWFNNSFIASLIPTVIWALGHVTYPIFPSTTRLLELTILGLIFSFLFLRFGFITVVFAHAIFDSIMMAISLMFMGSFSNIAIGIFYIVLPIPIAWLIRKMDQKRGMKPPIAVPPSTLQ